MRWLHGPNSQPASAVQHEAQHVTAANSALVQAEPLQQSGASQGQDSLLAVDTADFETLNAKMVSMNSMRAARLLDHYRNVLITNSIVTETAFLGLGDKLLKYGIAKAHLGDLKAACERVRDAAVSGGRWKRGVPKLHFTTDEVTRPDVNFMVPAPELPMLRRHIYDLGDRYLVVCGCRQTGKTSLAHAIAGELAATGAMPYYVLLGSRTLKCKTADEFWMELAASLSTAAKHNGLPGRFDTFVQKPNQGMFIAAVLEAKQQEWYLFDEASSVPPQALHEFCGSFHILKNEMKQFREGVIFFGVHSILRMLDEHNQLQISSKRPASPAATTSPSKRGPLASAAHNAEAMQEDAAQEDTAVGSHRQGPNPTVSYSGMTLWVPPFIAQGVIETQPFGPDLIRLLVDMFVDNRQATRDISNPLLPREAVPQIAQSIYELTRGNKGLTSFCLHCLEQAVDLNQSITQANDWDYFSSINLVSWFKNSPLYHRIAKVLSKVFPSRSNESEAKHDTVSWQLLKEQQQIMMAVMSLGRCQVKPSDLKKLYDLMSEGLLVVRPQGNMTGVQLLFSHGLTEPVEVELAAPMLEACMMQTFALPAPPKDPSIAKDAVLDIMWLLRQVCRGLDLTCLSMEEARLAAGEPSQYALQWQTRLLVPAILVQYAAFRPYSVFGEARCWKEGENTKRRLAVLLRCASDGSSLQRFGLELLANGDEKSINDHVKQAQKYSRLHTKEGTSPCRVYVVNFSFYPDERPIQSADVGRAPVYAADTPTFDLASWEPYFPKQLSNVVMVHILVNRIKKVAQICTGPDMQRDAVSQPIDSLPETGVQRLYRRGQ